MLRLRPLAALLSLAIGLCLLGLWSARSQTGALRRVTNTPAEGININPSLSGDGRRISFESTKDLANAGGAISFRAIRADLTPDPASFIQLGAARAPAPGISQDGSIIAFAAKENPLGTNPDGNSEIFLFDGALLRQITSTAPNDISTRVRDGNFQPSLSDDGRFIAFSSNRNLAGQNTDGNLEIFVFDTTSNAFTQLTNTTGATGASDAKISGDGARIAYIRDTSALPAVQRDLILQDRLGGTTRVLASNVTNLALTYGRAISDDGSRVVYSADVDANDSEVFLFDGRTTNNSRQITALGQRETEVPLHPTISGDGTRIAFAARRSITITVGDPEDEDNSDHSIELYTYDIPTGQFARVTPDAPTNADGFSGSTRIMEVVSSLNDDGSMVAFNFPRALSGEVTSGYENNSEIYVTGTAVRPATGSLTILNEASLGHEPATTKAIAPESRAAALGGALAFNSIQAQPQEGGTYPTSVDGTTVTVNGRPAQIFYVSPTQVNFYVPPQTELGTATVVVTNAEGFQSRGTVLVTRAAPGIFTESGDGTGKGVVLNADMTADEEFDPSDGQLRLIIFTTGVRKATQVTATAGGRALTVESYMASPDMLGMDEVHVLVPADLRGAGTVNLVVRADDRDSNPVTITFGGDACRDILINEVLADPPDGISGDANRDGTRSGSEDEFVELVNRSPRDIDISGYQLLTRSTSATGDTVRHTFAPGTIFPSGSAIVIFGGWQEPFDTHNPAFGGALVLRASSGGLSLTNSGGTVTLRDSSQSIVNIFTYGGSTGLNGDANQSLTRTEDAGTSPTCTGFTLHSTAPGSNGTSFSPGTRVNGTPFVTVAVARIEVTPPAATIDAGAKQQFTAHAYDANNNEISGIIFFWESSNPAVATIDQTGLATSSSPGTTEIRASARGVQSAPATLTVRAVERVLTSITVTPDPATIPVGGTQQFTAHGFDQFGNEITGLTFIWESTNTAVATIAPSTGLATGVSSGQTIIRATSQTVTGTATLNVTPPTVVINEVLADPPDADGDANHDGTRSGTDDEFVELVNSTGGSINISGWTLRTRTTSGTETVRHTFAANTSLPAGEAIVVFGGAEPSFNPANAAFACAQVVTASSGGLSLTNSGLTVIIKDAAGNLVAQFTYGTGTGLAADNDQSLTRSPDITGSYVQHLAATGAGPRRFSPGTRVNGTPFGSCPARLTSVTISPPSASILVGQTTQFTAQAFDQFGQPMTVATITFASDNTTVATVDSVTTDPNTGIATAVVTGHTAGTAHITAQATDGTTTVTSSQSTLTVNAAAPTANLTISDVTQNEGNVGTTTFTFTVSLSEPAPTGGVTFDIATADGTAQDDNPATEDNDYVARSLTGQTIPAGQQTYTFDVSVNGDTVVESAETFLVNVTNVIGANLTDGQGTGTITNDDAPPASTVVISQIYGGGGNTGAPLNADFIELFNRGTTAVDITGWSVQYASGSSTTGNFSVTPLCPTGTCSIPAGGYFLVKEAGGATGSSFTADVTGTIPMAATAGKVALVNNTTPLSAAATCPVLLSGAIDFVGYGAANCFEGSGPAPAPSATLADFRKAGGCQDTNDNAADFLLATPNPRNSSSPLNDCSAGLKPEITINDVTVAESTANATFTVTLSTTSTLTVTVDYATADGTATAGSDYQSTSGTVTFAPGETTKSILVPIINDTLDEASETFFVNLTNATNGTILDNQGQGSITDNDAQPSLSINDVSVAEGDSGTTSATFTATLSAASGQTVTVNFATADNTATAGSDYQSTSGTLTFNPGQTTQTINVLVNGDTTFEPDETFFVNLTAPVNATVLDGQGQGTITNDDAAPPVPAITIDNVSVTEGDAGTKTVDFTVSLSMNPTTPVTVDYTTANGTATAGSDYQSTSGTLTFNPGETSKPITVTINGDTLVEPDETFFVNLTNASANAIISDPQGVGTITNDDAANLVISQVYGGGGNSGATYTHDFIEIFNRGTTTVNFALTPYSVQYAGAGSNFSTNLTVINSGTIAPGGYFLIQEFAPSSPAGVALPTPDATGTINLAVTGGKVALVSGTAAVSTVACPGDDLSTTPTNPSGNNIVDFLGYGSGATCYEGTGPAPAHTNTTADFRKAGGCLDTDQNATDFFVSAVAPRNTASPLNDCSGGLKPEITINDRALSEGTTPHNFTVTLSTASTLTVTVDYATADGTATAGLDYTAVSGTLTFAPGVTTQTIDVPIINDTLDEASETYFVNLTNATNGTILDAQGQGTINDDDNPPTLSINDVSVAEGDSGTTPADFTVTLSAASSLTVTVNYATADNTATAGSDYQSTSGTLTFNPGETTKTVTVLVDGDTTFEPDETFFVNLTAPVNATILDGQGQGTITNDDAAPPTPAFSITDVSVTEGDAGTKTVDFTVSLSPASTGTVTVDYATADGTATAPTDYQSTSGTLTFNPGDAPKTITVTINGDILVESDETFFVNLSNPSAGTIISDAQGQGTITNDDTASVVISQVYGGGGNAGAAYKNDFIEIFNRGTSIVDISGWSVQYRSPTGTTGNWSVTNLCSSTVAGTCLLQPGQYYLVQEAAGAGGTLEITENIAGTTDLGATGGKVALVNTTTNLGTTTCPIPGVSVVDFVGYGNADCFEGSAAAPAPSATTADFRKSGGCLDTDQNGTDFFVASPSPRNTASPFNDCSGGLRPDITINDRALSEGTTPHNFTVTLSMTSTQTVTVDYATTDGTATAGVDYTAVSGTLTFAPGVTTQTINVPITNDTLDEPNETYFVNLSNASNAILVDAQGQGTINDNDNPPTISINDASVTEGDSGTKTLDFTVTLSTASGQTVTVDYATADNSATAGTDYQATSGTLTFVPGDTSETVSVTINGDTTVEADETFFVNLTTPVNATILDGQGQGTITNDDVTPSITITDVTLSEGNSGTTDFTFTVTISPASTQTVTVDYATADGSATAPGDYTAIATTQLIFAPGETSKQVTVQVNGDTVVEGDETFVVNLSNPVNATIGDPQGVGTITNDDAVVASADLSVTKADSPDPVAIGNDITYTITVTNGGTDTAVNAVLSDTVPTNTTFRSITTPAGWTCGTVPAVGGTGSISCTNPSFGVGSSIFTLVVRVNSTVTDGTIISNTASVSSSTTDSNSVNNSATQTTTVKQPLLVISQIYPGGGLTNASFTNDFIEIFNRGTTTVDFSATPYSVQFLSTGAATWVKTDLITGTIAPGQYFLIQGASGGAVGSPLPTPDATGTINLTSTTPGKVALVLGTTLLTGNCPGDNGVSPFNPVSSVIVDFVGYGGTAATANHCYEGTGPAPFSTSTDQNRRSTIRTSSCTDTNNNAADFTNPTNPTGATPPVPRNKATTPAPCP